MSDNIQIGQNQKNPSQSEPLEKARFLFQKGVAVAEQGNYDQAIGFVQKAIEISPTEPIFYQALVELQVKAQKFHDALDRIKTGTSNISLTAETWFYLAVAANQVNELSTAADYYIQALQLDPSWSEAMFNLGVVYYQLGRYDDAISTLQQAAALKPQMPAIWINLGSAYNDSGNHEKAYTCWQKALQLDPGNTQAHYNCGLYFQAMNQWEEAILAFASAMQGSPENTDIHLNLGKCYQAINQLSVAEGHYRRAVYLSPESGKGWYILAGLYGHQKRFKDAEQSYRKVIELDPKNDTAFFNLSVALRRQERIDEAMVFCRKALEITPHFLEAKVFLFQLAQHGCDWQLAKNLTPMLDELIQNCIGNGQTRCPESPLVNLRRKADPELNFKVARTRSNAILQRTDRLKDKPIFNHKPRSISQRIRIGYLSCDFRDHAVAHQIRGLLEAHNRSRFEIFGYAGNGDDGSFYRKRLADVCDRFVPLDNLTDTQAAQRIYNDEIDILVDMMGHTQGNRMIITALRPAPVQAGYLGFLGSSGADFIDYFITDQIVTPARAQQWYSERFVFLPHCYQANDNAMRISDEPISRDQFGLPSQAVVFCSFNQPYKIDHLTFQAWLTILKNTADSVLWLLRLNSEAVRRQRMAAEKAGIDPARIIYSGPLRIDRHLARLGLADLALDTFPYNGGATTANALWAGVPIVAMLGNHLVSRMTASALKAVGLPELITDSPEAYCRKAIEIAGNKDHLTVLRKKLKNNRLQTPLFDTQGFTRHLEEAYEVMMERWIAGKLPTTISIREHTPSNTSGNMGHQ